MYNIKQINSPRYEDERVTSDAFNRDQHLSENNVRDILVRSLREGYLIRSGIHLP